MASEAAVISVLMAVSSLPLAAAEGSATRARAFVMRSFQAIAVPNAVVGSWGCEVVKIVCHHLTTSPPHHLNRDGATETKCVRCRHLRIANGGERRGQVGSDLHIRFAGPVGG